MVHAPRQRIGSRSPSARRTCGFGTGASLAIVHRGQSVRDGCGQQSTAVVRLKRDSGQGGSDALFGNDGADYILCGSDNDNRQNRYNPGVGDFANDGIETNPARRPRKRADCEIFMYIP